MGLEGRRALFISYNGMLDPLGQSQVIPYLSELAKHGLRFTLLSFERPPAFEKDGLAKSAELRKHLASHNIEWHSLRYHQTPSLPATIFDVANGVRYARQLVRRNNIELLHARSHIPATIALALKNHFNLKMIFDVRGLMADEYVDADHWTRGSVPYRLTKGMEQRALGAAEGLVTLTHAIWAIMKEWKALAGRTDVVHEVIPCCADLQTFRFSQVDRDRRRRELGLMDRFVIVYSGSIDGWYLTEQMADFFAIERKRRPDAHALWLTPTQHERIRSLMQHRGVPETDYTVLAAAPREVSTYLSASDAGLAFIKPCFSKIASSPTKYAEYLACGLPIIINAGIGDSESLLDDNVGTFVTDFSQAHLEKAAVKIDQLVLDRDNTRQRTRQIAERKFDVSSIGVQRYLRLYQRVFDLVR
jgi:glycosyltransferase involved in cell wall biosynthesis